jgi:hypothetical protein
VYPLKIGCSRFNVRECVLYAGLNRTVEDSATQMFNCLGHLTRKVSQQFNMEKPEVSNVSDCLCYRHSDGTAALGVVGA